MPYDSDEISARTLKHSRAHTRRISVSEEDVASLRRLAEQNPTLASRVDVILASARGEPIVQIARATGMNRCSVWFWRTRFLRRGVPGIAKKASVVLSDLQRDELVQWRNGVDETLRKRAMVLLEAAESGDMSKAASVAGVTVGTARRWRSLYRGGGGAALLSALKRESPPLKLTLEERRTLLEWLQRSPSLARKAKAILAFADGASLTEAAERTGAAKMSVFRWREGFAARGLSGVKPKTAFKPTADQRRELEGLAASAPPDVAHRAVVLLALAEAVNLNHMAALAEVSSTALARWKHAFERAGAAGLEHPKAGKTVGAAKRVRRPVVAQIRLKTAVKIPSRQMEFPGETIRLTSAEALIAVDKRPFVPAGAVGTRVTAEIEWPISRESDEKLVLWIGGVVSQVSSAKRIVIELHRSELKLETAEGGSGSASGWVASRRIGSDEQNSLLRSGK